MQAERARKLLLMLVLSGSAGILLAQDTPGEAFLMYLSDYENVDGEWIDPADFAQQLEQMAEVGKARDASKKAAEVKDEKRG